MPTHYLDPTKPFDPTSVTHQLGGLLSKQSPVMQQAATRGMQAANRRGLLNSSMAVGAAQGAVLDRALPIASQEAQQAHTTDLARMNVAASERAGAAGMASNMEAGYSQMFSNIANNPSIPAAVRTQYLEHIGRIRDSNLNLVQQLYGIKLDWTTPGGAA